MAAEMYEDDLGPDPMRTRKRLSGKRLFLIVLLPLILIIAGIGAALHFGLIPGVTAPWNKGGPARASVPAAAPSGQEAKFADPVYLDLPDIIVNLKSDGPRPSFLKLSVSIEVTTNDAKNALAKRLPRIIDSFQTYLREQTPYQLQGNAGITRLRMELQARVQQAVQIEGQPPLQIKDILFKEMLVQ